MSSQIPTQFTHS